MTQTINLKAYDYALEDAAALARVPPISVRNWVARGILPLGLKMANGRRFLSLLDIFRLEVLHDLSVRGAILPSMAAKIANIAAVKVDQAGIGRTDRGRPALNMLIAWDEAGELVATFHDIADGPGHYRPPARNAGDTSYMPLRRVHLVLPLAQMVADLILATEHVERINMIAEGPVSV